MNNIQQNINIGMAINQALKTATQVNIARNSNKENIYNDILHDANKLIPQIMTLITSTRKEHEL